MAFTVRKYACDVFVHFLKESYRGSGGKLFELNLHKMKNITKHQHNPQQ